MPKDIHGGRASSWCSAYSDWDNHGDGGPPKWERYLTKELPQLLTEYRVSKRAAIAGNSMGGFGALKLAARHPGRYLAAASFSAPLDPLHEGPSTNDGDYVKPGLGCSADWRRVWGDPSSASGRARWEANSPYHRAADLIGLPIYVSAGNGDLIEQATSAQSRDFAAKLEQLGGEVTVNFHSGGHDWASWLRDIEAALPLLVAAVG